MSAILEPKEVYNTLNAQPMYMGLKGPYILIGLLTFLGNIIVLIALGMIGFGVYFLLWCGIYALLAWLSKQFKNVRVGYALNETYLV